MTRTLCLLLGIGFAHGVGAETLDDFEGEAGIGTRWTASGDVQVQRGELPAPAPNEAGDSGPSGQAIRVRAGDGFAVYTKVLTEDSVDWTGAEKIAFWVYQEEDADSRIDVIALEPDRKALFWRKCTFSGAGWQRIELPLRWFRWEERRLPRWSEVRHFGIRGNGGLDFWIDGIELVDEDPELGSSVPVEELMELAFPGNEGARFVADERGWVLSGAPGIDLDQLQAHLVSVREKVEADIPRWARDGDESFQPPRLLVFPDREAYEGFFGRLGERMLGTVLPPESSGYHVLGIAASYYDETWGKLRPVFTHEFIHSFAAYSGLQGSSGSDWFQEGIATLYQVRAHPQAGMSGIIRQGLDEPGYRNSLSGLCSGTGIPLNRYWQALSVVDFLIRGDGMADRFDDLLARMESTGSVDLREHLKPVYGVTFEELEEKWEAFARENLDAYEP